MAQWLKVLAALPKGQFSSQHLHNGLQCSATPVPGDPKYSSDLHGHQAGTWYTDIYVFKIFIYIK